MSPRTRDVLGVVLVGAFLLWSWWSPGVLSAPETGLCAMIAFLMWRANIAATDAP